MPQLDKVTFFSQFFWLCFFYLGFYFFIYKFFLPQMSRILKFRKKKMNLSHQGVTTTHQENEKVGESYETLVSKGFNTSRLLFGDTSQSGADWIKNISNQLSQTHLQSLNKSYITTMGECSALEIWTLQQSSFASTLGVIASGKVTKEASSVDTQLVSFFSLLIAKMQFFSANAVKLAEPAKQFALQTGSSEQKNNIKGGRSSTLGGTTNIISKKPGFTESSFTFDKKKRHATK